MPRAPHKPAELVGKVFLRSEVMRRGLLTDHQVRSTAWRHIAQDVYADAELPRDHVLVCRATMLHMPSDVIFAGPSAAALAGVGTAATFEDKVHVVAPVARRGLARNHVVVHRVTHPLPAEWVTSKDGLNYTMPARAAWECAGWLSGLRALAIVDAILRAMLATKSDYAVMVAQCRESRNARRANAILALADGRSRSARLSMVRGLLLGHPHLPPPEVMFSVVVPPAAAPVPVDLAWPRYQVGVVRDEEQVERLARQHWLAISAAGLKTPAAVVEAVQGALVRRGWRKIYEPDLHEQHRRARVARAMAPRLG